MVISSEELNTRLINQKLKDSDLNNPTEVVRWMGAMQAQDFQMARLAVGIRSNHSMEHDVTEAYNKGGILRTHLMRPTWHLVSAEDISWILKLTAPRIKTSLKSRQRNLELSEEVINKCLHIIEKLFLRDQYISRENISSEISRHNIKTDENRLSHMLLCAELEGLICSGPIKNSKISYALFSERVPVNKQLTREESISELTGRYYRGHSPATLKDFCWWSGLSLKDARLGLEINKNNLSQENMNGDLYFIWSQTSTIRNNAVLHLLPAYDEFLIGYQNRSAALTFTEQKKIISANGIFRPVVLFNGEVCGLWKKTTKKDIITIEIKWIKKPEKSIDILLNEKLTQLKNFYQKSISLSEY